MARIVIDWAEVFNSGSSSPGRADALGLGKRRRGALSRPVVEAAPPSRSSSSMVPDAEAAAKEDEREGGGSSAPAAKKPRKLDTQKEDGLLHMLGEINKSIQTSLRHAEPQQVPKDASPEEIFEVLRQIPKLARADLLRAYGMLIRDDRQFRSLVALPKNMRKEWLLMEIGSI